MNVPSSDSRPHRSLNWVWREGELSFRRIEERDIESLRLWRNAQQSVLRQQHPISAEHQLGWFRTSVEPTYSAEDPKQLLVVVEDSDHLVAYGGLTNIEWVSRRAEVSFLCETERSHDAERYADAFTSFLTWLKHFAFVELGLNRLFTETWSVRGEHIGILEACGWRLEGRMREHVWKDGRFDDALLHGVLVSDYELGNA
jgi:RimJ/RimL family protein N-acetyltransferase